MCQEEVRKPTNIMSQKSGLQVEFRIPDPLELSRINQQCYLSAHCVLTNVTSQITHASVPTIELICNAPNPS